MTEDRLSRIGPLCAVLFFMLTMAGFAIGAAGGSSTATLGDSTAKILKAYADPVGNGAWVGMYLSVLALAPFAVFTSWLFRGRRGVGGCGAGSDGGQGSAVHGRGGGSGSGG